MLPVKVEDGISEINIDARFEKNADFIRKNVENLKKFKIETSIVPLHLMKCRQRRIAPYQANESTRKKGVNGCKIRAVERNQVLPD